MIELGGTRNSKNPSGYRAIDNGDIPMTNQSYFQRGLYECWITKGKEIENYIAKEAIELKIGKEIRKNVINMNCFRIT